MKKTKKNKNFKISAPEDHVGYWLRNVSNNIAFSFSKKLETSKVTVAEWIILRSMYATGKTSPWVIADKTGLTRGAISKLLSRLLRKGLVIREESTKDRRYQEIKLSGKGEKVVPRLAKIADENDEYFFGNLSLQKRSELIKFLRKVARIYGFGSHFAADSKI